MKKRCDRRKTEEQGISSARSAGGVPFFFLTAADDPGAEKENAFPRAMAMEKRRNTWYDKGIGAGRGQTEGARRNKEE